MVDAHFPKARRKRQKHSHSHYPLLETTQKAMDPFGVLSSISQIWGAWMSAPESWSQALDEFWEAFCPLCEETCEEAITGQHRRDKRMPNDERFRHPLWEDIPLFHFIKKQYLLWDQWLQHQAKKAPGLEQPTRDRAAFWLKQYSNMLAPSNFFFTNPVAMQKAVETGGQSLLDAQRYFLEDLGRQEISMVSKRHFQVGENLATTRGDVIFQNELMELIYYQSVTESVHQIPILFVPPWINKFYILDLKPEKSPVNYLINKGFSVFMISWKNPTAKMRATTFQDYLLKGILEATQIVSDICQTSEIHAVGYCIGGTALLMLMAWLNAHPEYRQNNPIVHASTFCSLADFSHPGELQVFLDENSVDYLEKLMDQQGFLDKKQMQVAFRLLRPNNLIWNYYYSQYLMGEPPTAFDILYWNMDGTRLPKAMHSYYLREMYLKNNLVKPNALAMEGIGIDLGLISQPLYMLSTEMDHISPWHSVFSLSKYYGGPIRSVLSGSGHIVGVLNPPVDPPKRHYRAGPVAPGMHSEDWKKTFDRIEGSWWEDWLPWLQEHCGSLTTPPSAQTLSKFPSLRPAPGKYVLEP